MIVSLAIFSIVAVVALAALVKIVDANNKAQTIQAAVTSMSFSLDAMSRDLRTGSYVHCEPTSTGSLSAGDLSFDTIACSLGENQLIFFQSSRWSTGTPPCRLWYAYLFTTSPTIQVEKAEQPSNSSTCTDSFGSGSYTSIIPSDVNLSSYQLGVTYNSSTLTFPLVFVEFSGSAGNKEVTKTYFTVQTAASPRTP